MLGEAVFRSYPETFAKEANSGRSLLNAVHQQILYAQTEMASKKSRDVEALAKMKEARGLMVNIFNDV